MQTNSFVVGEYYLLEHPRIVFGLSDFIKKAVDDEIIGSSYDERLYYRSAKAVARTSNTVTFYIPLLGKEVTVKTKRVNITVYDNEVADIGQQTVEGGMYPRMTTYPELRVFAYDDTILNEEAWRKALKNFEEEVKWL